MLKTGLYAVRYTPTKILPKAFPDKAEALSLIEEKAEWKILIQNPRNFHSQCHKVVSLRRNFFEFSGFHVDINKRDKASATADQLVNVPKNRARGKARCIMPKYCVNKLVQDNGDHEVHKYSCGRLPAADNRLYLGIFENCFDAVTEAKKHFAQSNGCYYCSKECHTT